MLKEADEEALHLYERSMRQRRLSESTIYGARHALQLLAASLPKRRDLLSATAGDIEKWLAAFAAPGSGYAGSTHATYYRRAHAFYSWAERMEHVGRSPMAKMPKVKEEEKLIPLPDPADMAAVLAAAAGKGWRERRDTALLRLLLEAGSPRAHELAGLMLDRLDRRRDTVTIMGKGGRERQIPYGEKSGHALALWLRARAGHRLAARPEVFLTKYGPMDRNAVYKILAARCRLAGVPVIPPHHWRHYSAHEWALAGGTEGDAMQLFGWKSPLMAARYGRAAAASRAIAHAREHAQGDRL